MKKLTQEDLAADPSRYALIDVRSEAGYHAGHINGALNIPLDQLSDCVRDLPDDKIPVAVCKFGGGRSTEAFRVLHEADRSDAVILEGGTTGWSPSD